MVERPAEHARADASNEVVRLKPIQQKMLQLLSDGKPHSLVELHGCLHDDLGPLRNVYAHLTAIRKYLRATTGGHLSMKANYVLEFDTNSKGAAEEEQ